MKKAGKEEKNTVIDVDIEGESRTLKNVDAKELVERVKRLAPAGSDLCVKPERNAAGLHPGSKAFERFTSGRSRGSWYGYTGFVKRAKGAGAAEEAQSKDASVAYPKVEHTTENTTGAYAVVLDDVDKPAPDGKGVIVDGRRIALEPDFKVRTSENSWQYWYFTEVSADELPQLKALNTVLIKHELTDPEARGSARLVRLPGSRHQKTGFIAEGRDLKVDRDGLPRRRSLEEIADGLGQIPEVEGFKPHTDKFVEGPFGWRDVLAEAERPEKYAPITRALNKEGRARQNDQLQAELDNLLYDVPPGAFANGALRHAIAVLAAAAPGTQNGTLYRQGFNVGRFIGAGALQEADVTAQIMTAIASAWAENDFDVRKSANTLANGIRDGKGWPKRVEPEWDPVGEKTPAPCLFNVALILERARIDLFTETFEQCEKIDWPGTTAGAVRLTDSLLRKLRTMLKDGTGMGGRPEEITDYVRTLATGRERHAVREYLDSLPEWDGVERVDRLLIDRMGAPDTPYIRAVTRMVLRAAAVRAFEPGAKFDELPILIGKQGINKSSMLRVLCPDPDWFTDALPIGAEGKVMLEMTAGKWFVEFAELAGIWKKDADKLRAELSRQSDRGRRAYDRLTTEVPRGFVMVGTLNPGLGDDFIRELDGRRYLPVTVTVECDLKKLAKDRDQIWAEVVHAYDQVSEEPEALRAFLELPRALWSDAGSARSAWRHRSPLHELVEENLIPQHATSDGGETVISALLLKERIREWQGAFRDSDLKQAMLELGFTRTRRRADSKANPISVWVRPDS